MLFTYVRKSSHFVWKIVDYQVQSVDELLLLYHSCIPLFHLFHLVLSTQVKVLPPDWMSWAIWLWTPHPSSPSPPPGISIPRAACQTPQPPEIPLNFPTWLGTPGKNVSIKNAFTLFYNAKVIVSAIKREKNHFHTNHQVDFNNYFLAVKTCSRKA